MILGTRPSRTRGQSKLAEMNKHGQRFAVGVGVEVLVIQPGIYNGPNNKAQPFADTGDAILVASGPYLQDLIKLDLVCLNTPPEEAASRNLVADFFAFADLEIDLNKLNDRYDLNLDENGLPIPPLPIPSLPDEDKTRLTVPPLSTPAKSDDGFPWDFWQASGVTSQLAQALYEAGFVSKEALVSIYEKDGLEAITSIKGVAKKRATTLIEWAGGTVVEAE